MWLKWLKSALLVRHTCPTWRTWNTVSVKASSWWPIQMVLKGGEMGEGARQWKETSKFLLENLFKTTSDFSHMENKRPLLPWSLHTYRICIKHCMNSAASHPSSQLPCQKNNTGALLLAMAGGQWQTPTQPWPPDHHPSSWGPHYQQEVKADCFSAEDQRIFSQVHRGSGNVFTYSAILNKTGCSSTGCDQSNAHRTFWRHPSPCDPQSSRYFGCCPEQVMNNCKKSLKVQNPLFLISLQEPN